MMTANDAVVSHSAELVRGTSCLAVVKAPSSAHRAGGASSTRRAPSPQGEKGLTACVEALWQGDFMELTVDGRRAYAATGGRGFSAAKPAGGSVGGAGRD